MINKLNAADLQACVEIAYARNSIPENNCAYCSKSQESIRGDFEAMLNDPGCAAVGYRDDKTSALTGILGCFVNPENNWADCIGPFFKGAWSDDTAMRLFNFAKASLPNASRFNFYFDARNTDCRRLMEKLSAVRKDNEYILRLEKKDYVPQEIKRTVVPCSAQYEREFARLHGEIFPDIYVSGAEIIASIGKSREVFCALDGDGSLAGYGVLQFYESSAHLTAEIFAVREELRGKGYGWALLNTVVRAAFEKHNGTSVGLVVDKLNTHARELYYSCGFKMVTENEAYCFYFRY